MCRLIVIPNVQWGSWCWSWCLRNDVWTCCCSGMSRWSVMFRWCLLCVVGACVCVWERESGVRGCVCVCVWVRVSMCARVMYSDSIPLQWWWFYMSFHHDDDNTWSWKIMILVSLPMIWYSDGEVMELERNECWMMMMRMWWRWCERWGWWWWRRTRRRRWCWRDDDDQV